MKSCENLYRRYHHLILTVLGVFAVLGVWWIIAAFAHSGLIPTPWRAFGNLFVLLGESATYRHIAGSLQRLFIGFLVSFLFGSLLGLAAGLWSNLALFLKPLIVTLRTLPTAAVMLIFLAIFKFEDAPYYIVFLVVFPIVYESMLAGIRHLDPYIRDSLRLDGENKAHALFGVRLPLAGPYVLLGIFQSLGLGMKVEIMSEILAGDGRMPGLGVAMKLAYDQAGYLDLYGYAIIAVLLIALAELAIYLARQKLAK